MIFVKAFFASLSRAFSNVFAVLSQGLKGVHLAGRGTKYINLEIKSHRGGIQTLKNIYTLFKRICENVSNFKSFMFFALNR